MRMRGNTPAKVDAQGRLKIPTGHRRILEEEYGPQVELFVTSVDGENVLVYPLAEWEKIEAKLLEPPKMRPAKQRFLRNTSYFGQLTSMDAQGRVLIPQHLRERASIDGEVVVIGQLNHLEVWNHEKFLQEMEAHPFTSADAEALAELGI
ncbi:MAG TPA: division/cell wall cluster transcriptional repressor MraZ [Acidobacteriota bacterium]|jgi:MraZ protein|nr:division/cell wall cluster transcriptional repressor MraZ [Acidobacteriota bacterium]HRR25200.1 division/cell wall cluster transcriptional repressor MraZ [Acidobacteriota bacterium]HRR57016.1 division/cell wall cluster transcriptional repressor MraZ [Acidobacteriota bacterium]HRV07614.1 division/cell wall cluster transcriptional repressor MraZ [Acidobacteriota bacterium]